MQGKNWKKVAENFEDRSDVQCLHRWQKVLNPELVKGPWTKEVRFPSTHTKTSCIDASYSDLRDRQPENHGDDRGEDDGLHQDPPLGPSLVRLGLGLGREVEEHPVHVRVAVQVVELLVLEPEEHPGRAAQDLEGREEGRHVDHPGARPLAHERQRPHEAAEEVEDCGDEVDAPRRREAPAQGRVGLRAGVLRRQAQAPVLRDVPPERVERRREEGDEVERVRHVPRRRVPPEGRQRVRVPASRRLRILGVTLLLNLATTRSRRPHAPSRPPSRPRPPRNASGAAIE